MVDHLKYFRTETLPTPFCAGCGHGILMGAIVRAIDELKIDMDKMLFVSGIGCAGWIPSPHFAADTLHTTHGRPVAFATGAKLFNPSLKVVVIGGDGDIGSIGGTPLIHAARRNVPLTVICANNSIYGMTGGQAAPTTPLGAKSTTSPKGNQEPPFDLVKLAEGAGAKFSKRCDVYHIRQLIATLKEALQFDGFAFMDVISPCYTQFGKRNKLESAAGMIKDLGQRKMIDE